MNCLLVDLNITFKILGTSNVLCRSLQSLIFYVILRFADSNIVRAGRSCIFLVLFVFSESCELGQWYRLQSSNYLLFRLFKHVSSLFIDQFFCCLSPLIFSAHLYRLQLFEWLLFLDLNVFLLLLVIFNNLGCIWLRADLRRVALSCDQLFWNGWVKLELLMHPTNQLQQVGGSDPICQLLSYV